MANKRMEPVSYRSFTAEPVVADGLLSVAREGGDLERKVAAGMARMAAYYADQAETIALRQATETGQAVGRASAPTPVTVEGGGPNGYKVYTGSGIEQAKSLLRDEEGFRDTPYYDVNAHRVGYGSDTVTLADGRAVRVTPGMKISRADAERDLDYRLSAREGANARRQIGSQFEQLPANVQAGLYSVAYNYGSLPDTVLAAARTGNTGAIADAVAALPANSKRRQREAALIRGGGGVPATSSVGPISITPGTPGGFRPRSGNTIYDRAYNVAGTKTYLEELKFTMLQDQDAVYEAYKDDPVMLEKAMGELEQAHMKDHVFPEIAAEYSHDFRRMAYTRIQQARGAAEVRQKQQDRLDFLDRVGQFEEYKSQALARAAEGDQGANLVLASLQNDIDSHYNSAVARGILTEQEAAKAKKQSTDGMIVGSYVGQANGKSADEIATMRGEIYERWSRGEEPAIDSAAMGRIDTDLLAAEQKKRTEDVAANKALEQRGNEFVTRMSRGEPLSAADWARFELDAGTAPRGREILLSTQARARVADALRKMPIGQVEARVETLLKGDGDTIAPGDLDFARGAIKEYRQALQNDPLGKAEAIGIIPPVPGIPLDGSASPNQIRDAVAYRKSAAEAVSDHFGVPVRYFRPGEADAIMGAAAENPEALVAFTQSVADSFGRDAGKALAEISESGPALAHASGIAISTGDAGVTRDVARAMAAKQRNELPKLTPETTRNIGGFGSSALAGAFLVDTKTQGAALQTTQLLFEQEAQRRGIDPADIKSDGSAAQALYLRMLDRALGGRTIDGIEYGGMGEAQGRKIIVPADMRKDQPAELLGGLTDRQLAAMPPIRSTSGYAVTASEISRRGSLVSAGDGLYLVAMGDPDSDAPRWLTGEDGQPWRLDIRALAQAPGSLQEALRDEARKLLGRPEGQK